MLGSPRKRIDVNGNVARQAGIFVDEPGAANVILSFVDLEIDDISQLLLDVDLVCQREASEPGTYAYNPEFPRCAEWIRVEWYFEGRV